MWCLKLTMNELTTMRYCEHYDLTSELEFTVFFSSLCNQLLQEDLKNCALTIIPNKILQQANTAHCFKVAVIVR